MKEQLITFETAKLAKEKGLVDKEFSVNYYLPDGEMDLEVLLKNPDIKHKGYGYYAPTQSLLQKWLRDVHNIDVEIRKHFRSYNIVRICVFNEIEDNNEDIPLNGLEWKDFKTYEEALEKGLQEALKLI